MARSRNVPEDDVGIRPSRVPPATLPAPTATRCVALFELFRGGAGPVQLGRLHDGRDAPRLVSLRRLANLPSRELESATNRAQRVTHPRVAKVLGTYQYEDAWYIASEYVSGVTLFELGQTAVRQRTPVAAAVAVRIVLDALLVTAEAEQLFGDHLRSARSLYPESLWISDSGELFLSEMLVAPVLARITTGASYVAVTAGMSAPASDVRAAAVELARLACARLMNGNPAAWQTRELPDQLSELLARAISGGRGTETPAAFASALSALAPQLIADRQTVQTEVERLMGPERLRRREQLEMLQEQAADGDTTRVFRVARAPALPNFENPAPSVRASDVGAARLAAAQAPTLPPSAQPQAPAALGAVPNPTIPGPPPTPPPPVEASDSPISGVWREAHARMGVPGRRSRTRRPSEFEPMTPAPVPAGAPTPAARQRNDAPGRSKRTIFLTLVVVAVSGLLGALWLDRGSSSVEPGATQHAP